MSKWILAISLIYFSSTILSHEPIETWHNAFIALKADRIWYNIQAQQKIHPEYLHLAYKLRAFSDLEKQQILELVFDFLSDGDGQIKTLDLNGNELANLPESIEKLRVLTDFSWKNNKLRRSLENCHRASLEEIENERERQRVLSPSGAKTAFLPHWLCRSERGRPGYEKPSFFVSPSLNQLHTLTRFNKLTDKEREKIGWYICPKSE